MFDARWRRSENDLLSSFRRLYGEHPGTEKRLKDILQSYWRCRPQELKDLDLIRDLNPGWFLSEKMVGYVFYVDRFANSLRGVLEHIDYLETLGITYVHFMPCLKPRPGSNDGGYSVMDYGEIDPRLGTMEDFAEVTGALRKRGMSTCIDLVLNHTAKEHVWAEKAKAGDAHFASYYWMFDSPEMPRAYEESLVEVFPNDAPGNFTFYPDIGKWVWTTFNEHQWDLNWSNPDVFLVIVGVMLNLGNKGADVLRLDAVAFMWKRLGSNCQNQPEVHDILQALRAATRIAAPAMIHKAEAIVAPRDLVPYLGVGRHRGREANLAYHNNLMVQYWSSMASSQTALMTHVLRHHFPESFANASWATYIRCHDDIGWAITEEDGSAIPGTTGAGHRSFLSDFYSGKHPGSFARGAVFQENAATGDRRISGSFASLAGLESALQSGDEHSINMALARILLGCALIASYGGIPLIYMGDEVGLLNDTSYLEVPEHAHDNRWLHRPPMDWEKVRSALAGKGIEGRLLAGLRQIISARKTQPCIAADNPCRIVDLNSGSIFAFLRISDESRLLCVFNFSAAFVQVTESALRAHGVAQFEDVLSGGFVPVREGQVTIFPYGRLWLR
jgi:amylosucrase